MTTLSNILLNIKSQLQKNFVKKRNWFQDSKPFLLPIIFICIFIPIIYLLMFFQKENSLYQFMLYSLKKIHLSEKQIHTTSTKKQIHEMNQKLLKINPLSEEKKVLLSLSNHLAESVYKKMNHFFENNQIVLEEKNIIKHNNSKEIIFALKKPVFIKVDQVEKLVTYIESDPNISFESFSLEKQDSSKNQLKLNFNLKVITNND